MPCPLALAARQSHFLARRIAPARQLQHDRSQKSPNTARQESVAIFCQKAIPETQKGSFWNSPGLCGISGYQHLSSAVWDAAHLRTSSVGLERRDHRRIDNSVGVRWSDVGKIITNLDDRFGTEFNETDRLFVEQLHQDGASDENISQTALANPLDKFDLAVRQDLLKLMIQRIASNGDLVKRCSDEPDFGEIVLAGLAKAIHETVTQDSDTIR